MERKINLIVFDWNGVLISGGKKNTILLDLIDEILEMGKIDVAIWTSAISKSNRQSIYALFPHGKLKFIWLRDHTRKDPHEPIGSYKTIKLLDDIIENAVINAEGKYSYDSVLVIDDNIEKLRFNCKESRFVWRDAPDEYNRLREILDI